MKAVAYHQSLPIDNPQALQDVQLDAPTPGPRDLLVGVSCTHLTLPTICSV